MGLGSPNMGLGWPNMGLGWPNMANLKKTKQTPLKAAIDKGFRVVDSIFRFAKNGRHK